MDLQLVGVPVAVFGAARGLGHAIAAGFAAEGARVALLDRDPAVADAARALGEAHRGVVLDVTDYDAVRAAVGDLGDVRHVVFAVGAGSGKVGFPFWNLAPADWDRVLRVNLAGAVNVAHAVAPGLAAARRGTLLFLSSVAGQIGSQTDPPYSAAKAGLLAFVKCAARDLAPFGVRVNALCPGMVDTEMSRAVWRAWADGQPSAGRTTYEEWAGEKLHRVVPLGRWQTAEDVAAMAVFLASDRAANVTGQAVNVDGGYVMH